VGWGELEEQTLGVIASGLARRYQNAIRDRRSLRLLCKVVIIGDGRGDDFVKLDRSLSSVLLDI
jgi:hypothetical protein